MSIKFFEITQKLYWLDLETTGLSPQQDAILELAIAEADLDDPFDIGPIQNPVFRFVDQHNYGLHCNKHATDGAPDYGRCGACTLNDWAKKTHSASGLLEECARSMTDIRTIEDHLLERIPVVESKDDRPTLAGRGVHFDLGFLRVQMPRLAARLSYRVYDVSAVGLFCESMGMERLQKGEAHRAHDDILESIDHARRCAEWLRQDALSRVVVPLRDDDGTIDVRDPSDGHSHHYVPKSLLTDLRERGEDLRDLRDRDPR